MTKRGNKIRNENYINTCISTVGTAVKILVLKFFIYIEIITPQELNFWDTL